MMKKIAITAGVILLILIVIFLRSTEKQEIDTNPTRSTQSIGVEGLPDTDQDGLKDWEEVLWKTDPNKADTDQDGVSDGEEVKLIQKKQSEPVASSTKIDGANNPQESVPVKVVAIPPKQDALLEKKPEPLRVYGNSLGVHISAQAKNNQAELDIWNAYVKDPSAINAQSLKNIAATYGLLSEKINQLNNVPDTALSLHQTLAVSYKAISKSIELVIDTNGNSSAYQGYSDAVKNSTNDLIDMILFFQNNNMKFGATEPGSVFMINI